MISNTIEISPLSAKIAANKGPDPRWHPTFVFFTDVKKETVEIFSEVRSGRHEVGG